MNPGEGGKGEEGGGGKGEGVVLYANINVMWRCK